MRLLAVASIVTGAVLLVATDPDSAVLRDLRTRLCATLDYAARPDGPAWTPAGTQ